MKKSAMQRLIAVGLAVALLLTHTGRAEAMLAPVDAPGMMSARQEKDVQKIQAFLEQKQVAEKLAEHGFTPEEISSRLGTLTPAELHQVASRIDTMNPAGDGAGVVITVLVIGVLALLFVYLLKRV